MSVTTKAGHMCVDRTNAKSVSINFLSTFSNADNVASGPATAADGTGSRAVSWLVRGFDDGWLCISKPHIYCRARLAASTDSSIRLEPFHLLDECAYLPGQTQPLQSCWWRTILGLFAACVGDANLLILTIKDKAICHWRAQKRGVQTDTLPEGVCGIRWSTADLG